MENLAVAIVIFLVYISFVYPLVAEPSNELTAPTLKDYAQAISVEPEPLEIEESESQPTKLIEEIPDPWQLPVTSTPSSNQIIRLDPKHQLKLLPPAEIEESQSQPTDAIQQITDPWSLPVTPTLTSKKIASILPTPRLKLLPPAKKLSTVNRFNQMTVKQLRNQARLWNQRNPERQILRINKLKKQQLLEQLNTICA